MKKKIIFIIIIYIVTLKNRLVGGLKGIRKEKNKTESIENKYMM